MIADTIAAIATAPGQGSVAIVRLSGPEADSILMKLFHPAQRGLTVLPSHLLTYGHVMDGSEMVDECMAVIMRAPRSYTREDVAELQLHGGSYTAQRVLSLCLREGARLADPGEFTRRAFLNGRIDLSQAEAVMAVIAAQGERAHAAAQHQLAGGTAAFIRNAANDLYGIQAAAAACIDYPEEISDEEAASDLLPRMLRLADQLDDACDERASRILQTGLNVALCGRPNAGKSSLLNALLGETRAIVTPIPGTTRDMVTGDLSLGGSVIHLTDTAGLHATDDPVEQLGVALARRAMDSADVVLAVLDASRAMDEDDRTLLRSLAGRTCAVILNKSDLPAVLSDADVKPFLEDASIFILSTADSDSLVPLKSFLAHQAAVSDLTPLTQPRHIEAARRAARHLRQAAQALPIALDLATPDLQWAAQALGEITGDDVTESLLDRIFNDFCVGK